jgi:hypothetical protein
MNAVTLTNAARWNLDQAERVAKRGNKREADRMIAKLDADRHRANARQCLERLKDLS